MIKQILYIAILFMYFVAIQTNLPLEWRANFPRILGTYQTRNASLIGHVDEG